MLNKKVDFLCIKMPQKQKYKSDIHIKSTKNKLYFAKAIKFAGLQVLHIFLNLLNAILSYCKRN